METPSDGKTFALTSFLQPNDLYVETLSAARYGASNTLRAALASTIQAVPLVAMQTAVRRYPAVGFEILQHCIDNAVKLSRQLRRLKMEPVRRQVARAVYDVAETQTDGQRVLDRKITQTDLALYTGLSREAVNKGLKHLSQDDLLKKSDRGIEVNPRLAITNFLPLD